MSKVRRASFGGSTELTLCSRTKKPITKSRRSSLVAEDMPTTRRNSLTTVINSLASITVDELLSTPLVDVHNLYKKKVSKSSHKLESFFGEPTPVDVCVYEIKKEGLKAILESKVPLCYFLYYLLDEYSSENLFFFLEVEQFEKNRGLACIDEQRKMAQVIYNTYISDNAQLQINLDDKVKRSIKSQLISTQHEFNGKTIFYDAKISIYLLLESSFIRFLNTDVYEEMIRHCGELTIHYGERTVNIALSYLFQYFKHQEQEKQIFSDSFTELNNRHYDIIKSVLEKFVKNVFGKTYLPSKC
ncbi:hypothetical protein G6F37_006600 [Rhizopus arrhizus]|nr:hypothetical protein G6F38_003206 [Rhizopus arrhizus]KAG1157547.1 hypothetical protein G6F37_006600 [Rhizopus arrhizus]